MLGVKLTEFKFTPPLIPTDRLCRSSCNWANNDKGSIQSRQHIKISCRYLFILFKIKFDQFVILGQMNKKYFRLIKPPSC